MAYRTPKLKLIPDGAVAGVCPDCGAAVIVSKKTHPAPLILDMVPDQKGRVGYVSGDGLTRFANVRSAKFSQLEGFVIYEPHSRTCAKAEKG